MRIYTRGGDDGSTGLLGGARVSKADIRVEAYGEVDELNAVLGWARAAGLSRPIDDVLARAQDECFRLGSLLAAAPGSDPGVAPPGDAEIAAFEHAIDALDAELPALKHFVLPGGSEAAARLHIARTVCRRAERSVVALASVSDVPAEAIRWLNRLSDLLFMQARHANQGAGVPDVTWVPRPRA